MTHSPTPASKDALERLFLSSKDLGMYAYTSRFYYTYQPPAHNPLWFTDRHLAFDLALQNVVCIPAIALDLLENYEAAFLRLLQDNKSFPKSNDLPKYLEAQPLGGINGPSAFFASYKRQIGYHSTSFASKIHVHPNQPIWYSLFIIEEASRYHTYYDEVNLIVNPDSSMFGDLHLPEVFAKGLDVSVLSKILSLRDTRETLAVFGFILPRPDSEGIFSKPEIEEPGVWTISSTQSARILPTRSAPKPIDATGKWWTKYGSQPLKNTRTRPNVKPAQTRLKKTVWIPPRKGTRTGEYQPNLSHFLQRAWCRAVENDATFIVLNDGVSEHIGIRHRASNTMFITEPIDPFKAPRVVVDPGVEAGQTRSRKRRAADTSTATRASKRLKGEAPSANSSSVDLYAEIASRDVLLVSSFDFGVFHSPAPSSFLRVRPSCHPDFISKEFKPSKGNCKYPLTKCLNFVAKEKLGRGAIGTVFRGNLELETEEGCIVDENVVLKIPLGTKPAAPIYTEYKRYQKLAKAGVTSGIVKVYGVFEDVETGTIAMMMQYGGVSLLRRERERIGKKKLGDEVSTMQITLSQEEFEQLIDILKGINRAGILHNDLKPDNIVSDSSGRLFIIDFDSTRPMYIPGDYKESPDIVTLRDMFAGEFRGRYAS
ncbi:hypothetical protein CVT24_010934, partial [Panaeolus cyanescens]